MPNWCENDLTVTGKTEDVLAFLKDAAGKEHYGDVSSPFCFERFLPYPQQFIDLDIAAEKRKKEIEAMPEEELKKLPVDERWPKDGFNQGGYRWCVDNWGTKWPPNGVKKKEVKYYKNTARAKISFDTAWSPPVPVIKAAAQKHPGVKFTLRFYERGMGFRGVYSCKGSEVLADVTSNDYRGNRGG